MELYAGTMAWYDPSRDVFLVRQTQTPAGFLLPLQVQNQLESKCLVQSFTLPDGGVHKSTLADVVEQLELDNVQIQDSCMLQQYFCTGLPGQSAWLQTSAAQGLKQHYSGCWL